LSASISDETQYNQWPETLRYPTSTTSVRATSQQQLLERAAASQIPSLQGDVYVLLNDPSYQTLEAFSSNEWHQPTRTSQSSTLGSIEDLHGSIHFAVGGQMGHMSQLQYSAFDPIFWLHHG
jgi:tyrosinase